MNFTTAVIDANGQTHTEQLVRGLAYACHVAYEYEETVSKRMLWVSFMSLITDIPSYRSRPHILGFLDGELAVAEESGHGVVVMSIAHNQVNVNHVVPKGDKYALVTLNMACVYIAEKYPNHAINMGRIRDVLGVERNRSFFPRRMFLADDVKNLELCEDDVHLIGGGKRRMMAVKVKTSDVTTPVLGVLRDIRDIGGCRPLSMTSREDPGCMVYWHRFPCGTIVTFENPFHPLVEAPELPQPLDRNTRLDGDLIHPTLAEFVQALTPRNLPQVMKHVQDWRVPREMRMMLIHIAVSNFGISDDVLCIAANSVDTSDVTQSCELPVLVCQVGTLMLASERCSDEYIVDVLTTTLKRSTAPLPWNRWIIKSPFIYACLTRFTAELISVLCEALPGVRVSLALLLHARLGRWTAADRSKAHLLNDDSSPVSEDDPVIPIRQYLEQTECIDEVQDTKPKRRRPKKKSKAVVTVEEPVVEEPIEVEVAVEPVSHHDLVSRLSAHIGEECELIGSGLFFTDNDADVVVTMESASTLQWAYEALRVKTGWKPMYDSVDGEHVVILRGEFEGVQIDAQVWRGEEATTQAEGETRRALEFARRVSNGLNEERKDRVRAVHRLLDAARIKSHLLCGLPGIGATLLAVVASCDGTDDVLRDVHDIFSCESPCASIDDLSSSRDAGRRERERPLYPVAIQSYDGINVATRVTACTSRHMLDALAFARGVPDRAKIDAWRTSTMFTCAILRPKSGQTSISRTLHTSIAALDGHPLIDSVHVAWRKDDEVVVVRATLRENATYAFRETDEVEFGESCATVHRGKRSWRLCVSRMNESTTNAVWEVKEGVRTGRCVPNAPHLTGDVLACFDPQHWEVIF